MAKKKTNMVLIVGLIIVAFFMFRGGTGTFLGEITGNEVMTRTLSTNTIGTDGTFDVCYTVSGATGLWGVSYVDTITGGCTLNNGNTEIRDVMLSDSVDAPGPRCATINAPSTDATCTFSGDYKFGELPNVNFGSESVTVTSCTADCTRPTDMCVEAAAHPDGCGGFCDGEWTVEQATSADENCDNSVDRTELGNAITGWIANTFSRADLGIALQNWATGG